MLTWSKSTLISGTFRGREISRVLPSCFYSWVHFQRLESREKKKEDTRNNSCFHVASGPEFPDLWTSSPPWDRSTILTVPASLPHLAFPPFPATRSISFSRSPRAKSSFFTLFFRVVIPHPTQIITIIRVLDDTVGCEATLGTTGRSFTPLSDWKILLTPPRPNFNLSRVETVSCPP